MNQRLEHQQQTSLEAGLQSAATSRMDFPTPEAMIEADRERVQLPGSLAARLAGSVESSPAPLPAARPWWRRLLSGG
ncbi:MAG: hypothetical protein ACKO3N_02650 [Verrucomicrobiota bacterium]